MLDRTLRETRVLWETRNSSTAELKSMPRLPKRYSQHRSAILSYKRVYTLELNRESRRIFFATTPREESTNTGHAKERQTNEYLWLSQLKQRHRKQHREAGVRYYAESANHRVLTCVSKHRHIEKAREDDGDASTDEYRDSCRSWNC